MELRKSRRYCLKAPVFCWWRRPDKTLQEACGITRDISYRGVFVTTALFPSPGAHVELDVYLPSEGLTPKSVHLHGEGTVIRVGEVGTTDSGFAAEMIFQTEGYHLVTFRDLKKIQ